MAAESAQDSAPWHAAFPSPRMTAQTISRHEVLEALKDNSSIGKDFVLIDLRRNDYEGGTIHGSINLPAQSLYPTLPTLYSIFSVAKVKKVIWYCGSSGGRGTRAASWFADYLHEQDDSSLQSLILEGGIKGWVKAGEEYVKLVDGYDVVVWHK